MLLFASGCIQDTLLFARSFPFPKKNLDMELGGRFSTPNYESDLIIPSRQCD